MNRLALSTTGQNISSSVTSFDYLLILCIHFFLVLGCCIFLQLLLIVQLYADVGCTLANESIKIENISSVSLVNDSGNAWKCVKIQL